MLKIVFHYYVNSTMHAYDGLLPQKTVLIHCCFVCIYGGNLRIYAVALDIVIFNSFVSRIHRC